jgi:hypothetical protein
MTTIATSTNCWTSSTAKTLASSTAQSKKPVRKWSGGEEPIDYNHSDDDADTGTLTRDDRRRLAWYHAQAKVQWRNADEDEEPKKSNISEFGLCCSCKKHLNDSADFVCHPQKTFYRLCTKCHEDYNKPWYLLAAEQQPNP